MGSAVVHGVGSERGLFGEAEGGALWGWVGARGAAFEDFGGGGGGQLMGG